MTMRSSFLVFGAPQIKQEEIDEVVDCLRSGWLGTGPKVARLEQAFRDYKGGWGFPVAVNSCTAALHLSLISANLQRGDEVITSALTFCATVNAIIHAGCTPVLADVDPITMNISPASIRENLTQRTRAIVPVHFAGRPCAMDEICAIAAENDLTIIEDCAHAVESEYHGRRVGTFGDFGCFSFYVTKNVATGEGGMILAKREEDANRLKALALHGMSKDAWKRFGDDGYKHYEVVECGYKYNMMDLQAAIGIHQLARVEANWQQRREIWTHYLDEFADLPVTLPAPPEPNTRHGYHLFTILIDPERCGVTRDQILARMTEAYVGVGVHYRSIVEHTYYRQRFGWKAHDYPHSWHIGQQTLSVPLSAALSDTDVRDVVNTVRASLFN
jgi:dTDP-4-amino-4,6-dideoxygalactose transaminase